MPADFTTELLKRLARRLAAGEMDRRTFLTRSAQLGVSGATALATAGLPPRAGFARSTGELDALAPAYDVIVVGAGSAGAALAGRLSEDPSLSVLLLEAGPAPDLAEIAVPQAWPQLTAAEGYVWPYETVPQPGLDGQPRPMPRGKTLGGTSAINGMLFTRGHPADFAAWAAAGGADWGFEALLPVFRAMEDYVAGGTPLRGRGGPVKVARPAPVDRHPAAETFIAAMTAAGHRRKAQMNDTEVNGVAWSDMTIDTRATDATATGGRRRCSSAVAYLEPALGRRNLTVVTRAPIDRLLIEATGGGPRCRGVAYSHNGRPTEVRARQEVILAAGAIDSPRLLMLSGIGPAADLRARGIAPLVDLPGVGADLQEHLMLESLVYSARRPVPVSAWNHVEALGFWRSGWSGGPQPDLAAFFVAAPYAAPWALGRTALPENGVSVAPGVMRCHSRGRVFLTSADPRVPAGIDPAYGRDPRDLELLLQAVREVRAVMAQPAWHEWGLREVLPGPSHRTREELTGFLRRAAGPFCHPAGTCRMGRDPGPAGKAVVDGDLRVHGLAGLRVADASVMPLLPSTPPNAACLLLGERAAALVRQTAG